MILAPQEQHLTRWNVNTSRSAGAQTCQKLTSYKHGAPPEHKHKQHNHNQNPTPHNLPCSQNLSDRNGRGGPFDPPLLLRQPTSSVCLLAFDYGKNVPCRVFEPGDPVALTRENSSLVRLEVGKIVVFEIDSHRLEFVDGFLNVIHLKI